MLRLDLNCDMGESTHLHHYDIGDDLNLFPYLSSINIACGAHAGDAQTMRTLLEHALQADLAIGAHPGYEDRENFGRSPVNLSSEEIHRLVYDQVKLLQDILTGMGKRLDHVKPHGALYNAAAKIPELADAICKAVSEVGPGLKIYGLSGGCLKAAAELHGLRFVSEVFADRSYQDDGSLTPRSAPDALVTDVGACGKQLLDMALRARVKTVTGNYISLKAESICLHADGSHALAFATLINTTLKRQGVTIVRPS